MPFAVACKWNMRAFWKGIFMRLRFSLFVAAVVLGLTACGSTINGNTTTFNDNPGDALLNPPPISNKKEIQVREAWAQVGIPTRPEQNDLNISDKNMNGAVYMTIWNASGQSDKLVGATTDASDQPVLVDTTNSAGVKGWRKVDSIELTKGGAGGAGAYISLFPDNYQILLPNLKQQFKAGDKINVTLQFETAQPIQVEAEVRDPNQIKSTTGQTDAP